MATATLPAWFRIGGGNQVQAPSPATLSCKADGLIHDFLLYFHFGRPPEASSKRASFHLRKEALTPDIRMKRENQKIFI